MKKLLWLLALTASLNSLYAVDISGSSLEYDAKFSNTENYAEKDGSAELKINLGDLSLKYSADIKDNKTDMDTSVEAIYKRTLKNRVSVSVDATIDTENGLAFEIDEDSDKTFVKWGATENLMLGFYPFNFGSTVGNTFETEDVTKVYYIDGNPTVINSTENIELDSKTVPGVVATYRFDRVLSAYAGIGAVEYSYPGDKGFDLDKDVNAYYWGKRLALAYKFGFEYDNEVAKAGFDFVGHDESEEGGSLLSYAASVNGEYEIGKVMISGEMVLAKAGDKPYYANGNTLSSEYGDSRYYEQEWVGESDFAMAAKLAYEFNQNVTPYASIKVIGENFVYDGEDSAHKLRTLEEFSAGFNTSDSHGGLTVFEAGTEVEYFGASVNPYFEYKTAGNKVFSPENDLTAKSDKRVNDLEDTCLNLGVKVKYNF